MAETMEMPERKTSLARALVHVFNTRGGDIKLSIAELHQKLRYGEVRAWANRLQMVRTGSSTADVIPPSLYPVPIDPRTWTGMSVEWTENKASIRNDAGTAEIEDIHVLVDDLDRLWPAGKPPSPSAGASEAAEDPLTSHSAHHEAIARAIQELWKGKVPAGLTNDMRDRAIMEFAKKNGLVVPSARTIRRYFKPN